MRSPLMTPPLLHPGPPTPTPAETHPGHITMGGEILGHGGGAGDQVPREGPRAASVPSIDSKSREEF